MEDGFLENIISMFREDKSLFQLLGELLSDERSRVRIGVVALVESLQSEEACRDSIQAAIPGIAILLDDPNPVIRGDAAYLLGIIGHPSALQYLKNALNDENDLVRESVSDAIGEIQASLN